MFTFTHFKLNLTWPKRRSNTQQLGFTLIEVLVVVSIMAIIAAMAVPSFRGLIASNQLTATANELHVSLVRARTDAIRQGVRMTVCVSSNTTSCDAVTNAATWSSGWIGFNDPTRAVAPSVDAGETTTFVVQPAPPSIVILGTGTTSNYVSFSPDGLAKVLNGALGPGTIQVCSTSEALANADRTRHIVVNRAGRVIVSRSNLNVNSTCAYMEPPASAL